jgi:membrane-bound lytic murein transglycosylase D
MVDKYTDKLQLSHLIYKIIHKKLFLSLLIVLFIESTHAKDTVLQISYEDEVRILNSLDINSSFMKDARYQEMKSSINLITTKFFLRSLRRGKIFLLNLHEIIGNSDIPNIFLYMAMTESAFIVDAKSKKNARGLWQLMPDTAKHLKLKMTDNIDERLDPIKSTQAAIKYLEHLYQRFGKWYLAAIAYNCGETKLANSIKKANSDDLLILLNPEKKYLPLETRNYIRKIIISALLAFDKRVILKNNAQHLFGNCSGQKLQKVVIKPGTSIGQISKKYNISLKEIKKCNPQILNYYIPKVNNEYYIYLPESIANIINKE